MSYLVLARKYRPQKFDEVIGQEHITQTLKNAISAGRIAHAYLFAGPRGIGKTTTARIFAKALNCIKGHVPDPCQTCIPCREITQGICIDVMEIDAASNRGIDEIRALRENVKFAPAACRYKIYIIDEAHQITHDAFNALLKTLEEPPGHIIFVFCTTEPEKIPLTILSRCQRFTFRLVPVDTIVQRLEKIINLEKQASASSKLHLDVGKDVLYFIAQTSQGSVRDAESLMDEALSFSPEGVKVEDLSFLLSLIPQEYLNRLGQAFLSLDKQAVLNLIAEINDAGYNLHQLVKDLREYFRKLLLTKFSAVEPLNLSPEMKNQLEKESTKFSSHLLSRYISLLSQCLEEMKWSDQPRIILEIYALRLASPYTELGEIVDRIENIEKSLTTPSEVAAPVTPDVVDVQPKPVEKQVISSDFSANWQRFIEETKKNKVTLASCLEFAYPKELKNGVLTLIFPQRFYMDGAIKSIDYIESTWEKMFGQKIKLNCLTGEIPQKQEDLLLEQPETEVIEETYTTEKAGKNQEVVDTEPGIKKLFKYFPQARILEKEEK